MKRNRIVCVLCIAAAAVCLLLTACGQRGSAYSAEKDTGIFRGNFKAWTGTDSSELQLETGEELAVEWQLRTGKFSVEIAIPGQKPVYTADSVDARDMPDAAFAVVIPESGEYTVTIRYEKATGTFIAEKRG